MSNIVKVREIVRTHGPVKARQIVSILTNDYNLNITKSDVNSILYRLKSNEEAIINSSYQWTLDKVNSSPKKNSSNHTCYSSQTPQANAKFEYTDEQKRIINLDTNGNLLIRGQAGSGKTTVLAARAGNILASVSKGSMLFLTYNTALCSYVRKTFHDANLCKQMRITTFHEWAKTTSKDLGLDFGKWAESRWKAETIKNIIRTTSSETNEHRLYSTENGLLVWWEEEISWIYGQGIDELDDYLHSERTGRGTSIRISAVDRQIIWDIFQKYNAELDDENFEDYDNAGGLIRKVLKKNNTILPEKVRYDHVFIDEVQDFHQSWLLALAPVARTSLSMAGDLAQKIYKRNFTWKSVGIEVRGGRSRRLGGSHRTTKQIMDIALKMADNVDILNSEDYVIPTIPNKNGPIVTRILRSTPREAYSAGSMYVKEKFGRLRAKSVAVALPINKQAYGAKNGLNKLGVSCEVMKGNSLGKFSGGIVVTTYHQLKGLEFDHIILMGLDDSTFPQKFIEGVKEEDLNDELYCLKRLLYVAMTRAKESLTIIGSKPFCRFFNETLDSSFDDV